MTISTKFNPLGISGGGGTDAYVQNGLVLHLDGINNGNNGNTPGVWKPLVGDPLVVALPYDANTLATPHGEWRQNGYYFINGGWEVPCVANDYCTIEVLFTVRAGSICRFDHIDRTVAAGGMADYYLKFPLGWEYVGASFPFDEIIGFDYNVRSSGQLVVTPNNRRMCKDGNAVYASQPRMDVRLKRVFLGLTPNARAQGGDGYVRQAPYSGTLYSVRIYNRPLTPDEVKHNYELDRLRYNLP